MRNFAAKLFLLAALSLSAVHCQAGGYLTTNECDRDRDNHLAADPECGGDDCDDRESAVHPSAAEICGNDRDDNCDGVRDEGCTCIGDEVRLCNTDPTGNAIAGFPNPPRGRCSPGMQYCENGRWGRCIGTVGPRSETAEGGCNGVDDDCDGVIDNGYSWVGKAYGAPCTVGMPGACMQQGRVICVDKVLRCSVEAGQRTPTVCGFDEPASNGSWDWNCDGKIEKTYCLKNTWYTSPLASTKAPPDCKDLCSKNCRNAPPGFYLPVVNTTDQACGSPLYFCQCSSEPVTPPPPKDDKRETQDALVQCAWQGSIETAKISCK